MNEVLIGSLIDKVDEQERKIAAQEKSLLQLKEDASNTADYSKILSHIQTGVERLQTNFQKTSFPQREVRQLSAILEMSIDLLRHPVKKEIVHHHHATKTIWIAAALFLVVCLISAGWYNTYEKLELYKANDTKYRYVKLQAWPGLSRWLREIDSLYLADPKMRNIVIAREEQNQRNFEMMQRAVQMEKEAKELKEKVRVQKGTKN